MVLILDAFDSIIKKRKKINEITQRDVIEGLMHIYTILSSVKTEILQKISEIIILNQLEDFYTIDNKTYNKFLKQVERKPNLLFPLFKETKIFNIKHSSDVFILKDNLIDRNREFIFFDDLLTNYLIYILTLFERVSGYRVIIQEEGYIWKEIEDVEKYLMISLALYYKVSNMPTINNRSEDEKDRIRKNLIDIIINKIEKKKRIKHLIFYNEWESEDIDKISLALRDKFRSFEIYYCESNKNNTPPITETLFAYGLENLDPKHQISFLKNFSQKEYQNQIVIIFNTSDIDIRLIPEFSIWTSTEIAAGINDDINAEISQCMEKMESRLNEYKKVIEIIADNEQQKKEFLEKLTSYTTGKDLFYPYSVNFWYELKSLNFYPKIKMKDWGKVIYDKHRADNKKTRYEVRQDGKYWTIIFSDKKEKMVKQIDFTKSKHIRYLVYVIEYFGVNNPICFEDLSRSISKWMTGEEKVVQYKTFYESINDLFKEHTFWKPISKYFSYNNPASIYYQENIEIQFEHPNIEIPYIQLSIKE